MGKITLVALRPLLVLLGFSYAYRGDQILIESLRQPSELINDLSARIEQSFLVGFSISGKYVGRISDMNFQIYWYEGLRRNSHIPVLYGNIEQTLMGSKIIAHFDISFATKVLFVFWWAFSIALGFFLQPHFVIVPFMLGTILLAQIGMAWGCSDKPKLLDLLERVAKHEGLQPPLDGDD
ncbi:hypothetical protein BH10CYA1_BH10CYA1_45840 [soil metagenome]